MRQMEPPPENRTGMNNNMCEQAAMANFVECAERHRIRTMWLSPNVAHHVVALVPREPLGCLGIGGT
jgi:hypothetical protein